ncbi:LysR substrate-binding domain-containing protein [Hwanghaeella sp.]|uniref:LysR substrate-binding domain-containing protein n=1 Tax=Hwanghaeella sp. TaxID=2605943 RepID=UPI003CCBE337
MPRQLPPLNALRAFDAAGRLGSFSGAAEEMNVTHAAISRHVRGLEKRLGVQLFRTVPRGVELTEAGARYLDEVRPAFDRIAEATEALTTKVEGLVTVSVEGTFAQKWLMPRLGGFHAAYPEIELRIDASSRLADIEHYEADLAIRYSYRTWPELKSDHIVRSTVFPVGAPSMVPDGGVPKDPRDLLQFRLLHEDRGEGWAQWFRTAGVPDVRLPPVSGPLASILAIEGALSGQGLALISYELIAADVDAGRLIRFSKVGLTFGDYSLLYLPESMRRKPVRAFRDWLLTETQVLRG